VDDTGRLRIEPQCGCIANTTFNSVSQAISEISYTSVDSIEICNLFAECYLDFLAYNLFVCLNPNLDFESLLMLLFIPAYIFLQFFLRLSTYPERSGGTSCLEQIFSCETRKFYLLN
jgi:hypothetical protein